MKTNYSFGSFIKEKRLKIGISLRKFSEQVGISPVYLSNLENDRMPAPKDEVVSTIAKLLLLDEPFSALDATACHQLEEFLINLKNSDTTVLFTSHEPEYIHRLADSLFILKEGKLSFAANPKDLSREQLSNAF